PVISISLLTSCHADRGEESRPSSATCQCPSVPAVSAYPCHLPVPISATSMPHISAHLSCLSVPVSATYQCQSVPPISTSQCRLSVPVSVT
ncbi:unnamed protein product, partial [Staurois parvus]